jgi:hypothetical protein
LTSFAFVECGAGPVLQFAIPDLRVGTLDSLLTLSDDLVKMCLVAEQTLAKVYRQIVEINPDQVRVLYEKNLRLDHLVLLSVCTGQALRGAFFQ